MWNYRLSLRLWQEVNILCSIPHFLKFSLSLSQTHTHINTHASWCVVSRSVEGWTTWKKHSFDLCIFYCRVATNSSSDWRVMWPYVSRPGAARAGGQACRGAPVWGGVTGQQGQDGKWSLFIQYSYSPSCNKLIVMMVMMMIMMMIMVMIIMIMKMLFFIVAERMHCSKHALA